MGRDHGHEPLRANRASAGVDEAAELLPHAVVDARSVLLALVLHAVLGGCSLASSERATRAEPAAQGAPDPAASLPAQVSSTESPSVLPDELDDGHFGPVGAPAPDRQLAAGQHHTCVLRPGGAVACWGANSRSQVGDGSTTARLSPTLVTGLTDAISVVAGADFTCARRAPSTVSCWGNNEVGQLGNGTKLVRPSPTDVEKLTDVAEVVAGSLHACARRAGGTVACWGANHRGQIGDGSLLNRVVPVEVAQLSDVLQLAAGKAHTCARRVDGTVACWGHNFYGQVGDGLGENYHLVPFVVPGLHDAVEISAGHYHTCVRHSSGDVSCWGQNLKGQLGDGSFVDHASPRAVLRMKDVVQITAGGYHTCARHTDSHVSCWGYNEFGQLGDASVQSRPTPVSVVGLTDATDVIAGRFSHTCARRASGSVACWGWNLAGEIGDGTTAERSIPVNVVGLP